MGVRSPYNSEGTEHLYSSDSTPVKEAAEVARLARAMKGVNTHRKSANDVFNPGDEQQPDQTAGQKARGQQVASAYADSVAMEGRAGTAQALQSARAALKRQNQVAPIVADQKLYGGR